jgi:prepilin-type N-terminal cleavage/methylation domain-containing protein
MQSRSRAPLRQLGPGFTLIELVLVVALISLLMGAIAFNFSSAQSGKALEEGSLQFESLLRLARAHASSSGRPVYLALIPTTNSTPSPDSSNSLALAVLTQPDPLRQPHLFQSVPVALHLLANLAELIQLQIPSPHPDPTATRDSFSDDPPTVTAAVSPFPFSPLLTFQPDGSSDPATFILLSQDPEDLRRIVLQLQPVSGIITRRWLAPDADPDQTDPDNLSPDADAIDPAEALTEVQSP